VFQHQEKRAVVITVFSLALFASLMACHVHAQSQSAAAERVRQRQTRRNDQMENEIKISALEKESRQPEEEKQTRLAYAQLKADFEQLQTVNNRMMAMVFTNKVLDYKSISESIAEIRKRATRLKSNLPLPATEKSEGEEQSFKEWDEINQAQVKLVLQALDDLIQRFVTNPVFQQPQVVDVQQSSKAKRDLESIIKLSEKIRKGMDKLVKASMP